MTTAHYLLAALVTIGVALIITILWLVRRSRDPLDCLPRREDYKDWISGLAAAAILLAVYGVMDSRDARILAQETADARRAATIAAGYLPPERARLTIDLNQCPPRTDGMTDQVLMAIATQADGQHIITGCSRIAVRQYTVKPRVTLAGGQ